LAATVLVASVVGLERSSIGAALAGGAGEVLKLLALAAALAAGVAAVSLSQLPLLKATLSHPKVASLLVPSLPLAAALFFVSLVVIERASAAATFTSALPRLPDFTAVALLLLLVIRGVLAPGAELVVHQRAAAARRTEAALVAAPVVEASESAVAEAGAVPA